MALTKEQILTLTCLKEVGVKGVGAIVVGGLSLGKTKHERPIQGSTPQPFNPVFPPQSTADQDDLPF